MSSKMKVICQKDDTGRLNWIEIYKPCHKEPLRLDFVWDSAGLTREIEFSGRSWDMPSIADVMLMFNQGFIERIGLLSFLQTIGEIRNIANIEKIGAGMFVLGNIINGDFETGDFFGWKNDNDVGSIETDYVLHGSYACKMKYQTLGNLIQYLKQYAISEIKRIVVWATSRPTETAYLDCLLGYTDGSQSLTQQEITAGYKPIFINLDADTSKILHSICFCNHNGAYPVDYFIDFIQLII